MKHALLIFPAALLILAGSASAAEAAAWWNPAWTQRQPLTLDTAAADLAEATGPATVLVRISDGSVFAAAREDGADIRFVAADGKTVLPYQIESWDNLLNEAFVWVKLPDAKPSSKETFHLYFGNADAAMPAAPKATDAFDTDTALVYHFAGRGAAPADTTANNNAATGPAATAEGSLIGNGLRLAATPVVIPESPSLGWKPNQSLT